MAYSSRRRDDPYAQDAFYGRNPPYWEAGDAPAGPPPRRSKSARHPGYPGPGDRGPSRRHRDDDAPRGSSHRQGDGRRARSPPPSYRYEDRRGGDPRRDARDARDIRDPRDHRSATRDVRDSRPTGHGRDYYPPRGDHYEADPRRHQRSKTAEDPGRYRRSSPDYKSRDHPPRDDRDRDRRGGYTRSHVQDPSSAHGSRTKTRDFADDGGRDRHGGHSSRSHVKDKPTTRDVAAAEPPRGRDKHASGGARGIGAKVRSSTMPAAQTAAKWWQNPLVQAGARTAFSAGATAAMNNRGGQGDWLGAKGAKVATAAIGAALMDGFMGGGKKEENGAKDRGRSRSRDRGADRSPDRSRDKSSGRSKSEGRGGGGGGGGDFRQKLMQSGMDYVLRKAAAR
ncbi:hypothetical protein V2A60_002285 [Cordyceps javanica]